MEKAGKKLGMKVATEIFADRNYEDDGNLVSRTKKKCNDNRSRKLQKNT